MAYPKDYVHSDVENLNLEPFPQMFYETFTDEDGRERFLALALVTRFLAVFFFVVPDVAIKTPYRASRPQRVGS